jgi:hypothetical protein
MQLVRAVNRLSRQAAETTVVMSASTVNLGLTADTFNFRLEADPGGDIVGATVDLEVDAEHVGRVIVIRNSSPSLKLVATNSGGVAPDPVRLLPQQSMAFYATVGGVSGCQWIALGGDGKRVSFTASLVGSVDGALDSDTGYYWIDDKRLFFYIPTLSGTLTTDNTLSISLDGIFSSALGSNFPIRLLHTTTFSIGYAAISGTASMAIARIDGSPHPAGSFSVGPFTGFLAIP